LDSGCLLEIDCLISDIDMPGMEGYALLRAVRAARPELPVILVTGYPETLRGLAHVGESPRCFTKPFAGPELLGAVGEAIQKLRG
jgi:CheY-like chemotaxis protein